MRETRMPCKYCGKTGQPVVSDLPNTHGFRCRDGCQYSRPRMATVLHFMDVEDGNAMDVVRVPEGFSFQQQLVDDEIGYQSVIISEMDAYRLSVWLRANVNAFAAPVPRRAHPSAHE